MIHGRIRWLVGGLATLVAASAVAGGEIRIFSTATVRADAVKLGDIAAFRDLDSETTARLAALVVHAAPAPGSEALVRIDAIRAALTEAEISLLETAIVGASRCKVSRPAETRPAGAKSLIKPERVRSVKDSPSQPSIETDSVAAGATLESYMRQYIAARVGEPAGQLEIRFSPSSRRALEMKSSTYRFAVQAADSSASKLGLVSFRVDVFQADQRVETVSVVAEALLTREVVVARSPINRGQAITPRHLKLEARKFDDLRKIGLTDLAAAIGQEAGDMIKAGDMLNGPSLKAKPAVRRGEAVTIWRRGGALMIKTTGKAQADGMLGQMIKVRRDGSKLSRELIDALVTGPGTVELVDATQVASR